MLVERYAFTGGDRIRRQQLVRWAILQHYEVCETPLLDVSQSARIAASFASQAGTAECFFYVLGVPNISGAITASAEASLTVLRLSSVCPPEAVRPHLQEGFLLSEYPELSSTEQKAHYENYEIDFLASGLLLSSASILAPSGELIQFPKVLSPALYPQGTHDPLLALTEDIRRELAAAPSE